jgi:glycine/D-amino acid oxidase-like deaminating enzyme
MQTEIIIVGQGLCGTWLSWWLEKAGKNFIVIDDYQPHSASRIASGIINPVTGRALAKTWMADALLPFAMEAYGEIGNSLGIDCIRTADILHSFPTAQMHAAFLKRMPEMPEYLSLLPDIHEWEKIMNAPFGIGIIYPALLIDLNLLLNRWQLHLEINHQLRQESFEFSELSLAGGKVMYKDIFADQIIFCDGVNSMELPFFNRLPFAPNKGEALLLEIEGLPSFHIYKKGMTLVPYPHFNKKTDSRYFWVGSTYDNQFIDKEPTTAFRKRTEQLLAEWIRLPYRVVEHWAGIRPAVVERRPFAGMHPIHGQVGILNGMGTKGCSLAPWFGKQLSDHLTLGAGIDPEAALARFSGILSR